MAPMGPPFPPFGTTAKVPSSDSTVRMMSRLSYTEVWGDHPAAGPTSGSLAQTKTASRRRVIIYNSGIPF